MFKKTRYYLAIFFSYAILIGVVAGANPFRGETLAPMDLLLSFPGWDAAGWSGTVTHHERSDVLDARIPTWIKLKKRYRAGDPAMWEQVGAYGRLGTFSLTNSVFSPSFLLFVSIEDDALAYYFAITAKLLIAAFGMFLFLRLFLGTPAAWFGGAVFAFVGFNAAWLYWGQVATSCWIPWLLWAVAGWTMRRQPAWTLAIAASSAMLITGGFPTVAVYGFYAAVLLAAILLLAPVRRGKSAIAAGIVALVSIGIGFALVSLPIMGLQETLSLLDLSYRRGGGLAFSENWLLFLNPYVNGLPRVGHTLYAGVIATIMAVMAIVLVGSRRIVGGNRISLAVFSVLALVGSIVFAFGLLPREVLSRIPAIGTSNWIRVVVITGFCIAALAALFADYALERLRRVRARSLQRAGFVLLAVLGVAQVVDQALLFRTFNYVSKEGEFLPETPSIKHVRENLKPLQSAIADWAYMISGTLGSYGIPEWYTHAFHNKSEKATLGKFVRNPFVTPTAARFPAFSIRWESPLADKLGIAYALVGKSDFREILPKAFRVQPLGGHKAAPSMPANTLAQELTLSAPQTLYAVGLVLATYNRRQAPADVRLSLTDGQGRVLATTVTGARYVKDNQEALFEFPSPLTLQPGRYRLDLELVDPETRGRLTAWWVETPENRGDLMLINGEARPGAMIYTLYTAQPFNVDEWLVMQHEDEPSTLLLKNRQVPGGAYFLPELGALAPWSDRDVTTRVVDNQNVEIEYGGSASGYIVLPMRRYPGWRMLVDGRPVETRAFLGMLPAVPVSGPAKLEYRYRTTWLDKGIAITLIGVLALFAQFVILRSVARRRRGSAGGPQGGQ